MNKRPFLDISIYARRLGAHISWMLLNDQDANLKLVLLPIKHIIIHLSRLGRLGSLSSGVTHHLQSKRAHY